MIPSCQIICGDALTELRRMEAGSISCVVTSPPYFGLRRYLPEGHPDEAAQIGLEQSPDEWAARLVEVFREVRRVLHPTGTLFCNIGDAYASAWPCHRRSIIGAGSLPNGKREARPSNLCGDLKEKDLIGLPWLLAFALRRDGWWLRSAITLCKQNPMPESVTDRPTSATEMMFLFAKQARYYYDQEAVRQRALPASVKRCAAGFNGADRDNHYREGFGVRPAYELTGRNLWNWWPSVAEPLSIEHFAAMPTAWVRPCVLAGTSERGVCPECLAPWVRCVEPTGHQNKRERAHVPGNSATKVDSTGWGPTRRATDRWAPGCSHGLDPVPAVVMDPFSGSGTTGLVALQLGRSYIGIELNPEYVSMSERRLAAARAQGRLALA